MSVRENLKKKLISNPGFLFFLNIDQKVFSSLEVQNTKKWLLSLNRHKGGSGWWDKSMLKITRQMSQRVPLLISVEQREYLT